MLLHYLAKLETRKSHLFTIILCSTLQDFNQSLFDYFNLVDSQHIFILMYDSLNLIISGVHLPAVGGGTQANQKSEVESFASCSVTVFHA